MKKALSLILAMILTVTSVPVQAFAEENETENVLIQKDTAAYSTISEETTAETILPEITEETAAEVIPDETMVLEETAIEEVAAVDAQPRGDAFYSGTCGENLTWELDPLGNLIIRGTGPMDDFLSEDGSVPWYAFGVNLKTVTLEEGVTSIGDFAFCGLLDDDCGKLLESIKIPGTVSTMGDGAFSGNEGLVELDLPDSIISFGDGCFAGCAGISRVVLPKNITSIPNNMFFGCVNLSSVTMPFGLKYIGEYAFDNCMNLETIEIPANVVSIGEAAFEYCTTLKEVIIPDGVTEISAFLFNQCSRLTSIVIPENVAVIDNYAFDDCNQLKDIYFKGTEEQWNNINIKGNNNGPLTDGTVTIHFNYDGSGTAEDNCLSVRYYHAWNESEQKLYFGSDDVNGCLVTAETSEEFRNNPTLFLGAYVIVETMMNGDQEILINATLPVSKIGVVTDFAGTVITIDGQNYDIPEDLNSTDTYLNQTVVYHLLDEKLEGMHILKKEYGMLTHWNSDGKLLSIQPDSDDSKSKIHWLSASATEDSQHFIYRFINNDDTPDVDVDYVDVDYLVDSDRHIFEILPYVKYRPGGFSEDEHGWPLINTYATFNYEKDYDIPLYRWYAHGESIKYVLQHIVPIVDYLFTSWGGNCFGLSLLAAAQYEGLVDMKPRFSRSGETLNEFGYDTIDQGESGDFCALYHYDDDGNLIENTIMIGQIEQAQVSQLSAELLDIKTKITDQNVHDLLEYLYQDDPVPLLFLANGHVVVAETAKNPIYVGKGQYLIPLYDCNAPQAPDELTNPRKEYLYDQSMLYVDTENKCWNRIYNRDWRFSNHIKFTKDELAVYDVTRLGAAFFDDYYSFAPNQLTILFETQQMEIVQVNPETGDQTIIFEVSDGNTTVYNEACEYSPYSAAIDESGKLQGILELPLGKYIIHTGNQSVVNCMYDEDIVTYGHDGTINVTLDCDADQLSLSGTEKETNVACIHASSEVDFCTAVHAVLSEDNHITLSTDTRNKYASVSTNIDPKDITMIYGADGEVTEDTSAMIHQHNNLIHVPAADAKCEVAGNIEHYRCECGKTFEDSKAKHEIAVVQIPALEHEWEYTDSHGKVCKICNKIADDIILRIAGKSRVDTALEVAKTLKETLGVEKLDAIIIASGEDKSFADALTGSYLANKKGAPILLYRNTGMSELNLEFIKNNLSSNGTVYLLGDTSVVPASVEESLAQYKIKRLAGISRFDTNLEILKEAGVDDEEILIVRGFDFADSLSASATGLPILLVNEVLGTLTDTQIEFLKSLNGNKLTIIGGTLAISEELEAKIEAVVETDVQRVFGGSREETSVEIAKRYFTEPSFAVVAYSRKCPDGLCGGPLAYAMNAPLLLTNTRKEAVANAYITDNGIVAGYVLGGTTVVSDETARLVFGLSEDADLNTK